MNNNTKFLFNVAKKNAAKGKKSTTFGKKTFNFENQPRKSHKPKVAAKGKQSQSEIVQSQEQAIVQEEIKKIEETRPENET